MKQEENWRPVVFIKKGVKYDLTGSYEVSDLGNVRNINYRGTGEIRILNPWTGKNGYRYVGLVKEGKNIQISVHRLVAFAFVENPCPEKYNVVNHVNEIPGDDRSCNLEWCDDTYNLTYGTAVERRISKQRKETTKIVCIETEQVFDDIKQAAEFYGAKYPEDVMSCYLGKGKAIKGHHFILYSEWILLTEGLSCRVD